MKGFDAKVLLLSDQLIEVVHVVQVIFIGITVGECLLEFFQSFGVIGVLREHFPEILEIGLDKRDNVVFGFICVGDLRAI